jgi:hypothetical protein
MSDAVTIILAMLFGFVTGLFSFKIKSRWCSACGAVKSCPTCTGWAKSGKSKAAGELTRMQGMP